MSLSRKVNFQSVKFQIREKFCRYVVMYGKQGEGVINVAPLSLGCLQVSV